MTDIQFRFIPHAELTHELQGEIDALDHIAFAGDEGDDDPEFSSIQWATPDWMVLGFFNEELVTQLFLPKREIKVGAEMVWAAGVGGMATHPDYQHKGYGSALLAATASFMQDEIRVPFGLLICADETRPFYERARWQFAADALYFWQEGQRRTLKTCVMILPLEGRAWPTGGIDLCGTPW
ncbi:MAG: GNAT family N-acetyltransferase [Chloroflexota bacterium]